MPIEIDLSTAEFDGTRGLPNSVRYGLLAAKLDEVALTLDVLLCSGVVPGTEFQFAEMITLIRALGLETPESILRRGLRNKIFNPVRLPYNGIGQRPFQYRMPEIASLISKYSGFVRGSRP